MVTAPNDASKRFGMVDAFAYSTQALGEASQYAESWNDVLKKRAGSQLEYRVQQTSADVLDGYLGRQSHPLLDRAPLTPNVGRPALEVNARTMLGVQHELQTFKNWGAGVQNNFKDFGKGSVLLASLKESPTVSAKALSTVTTGGKLLDSMFTKPVRQLYNIVFKSNSAGAPVFGSLLNTIGFVTLVMDISKSTLGVYNKAKAEAKPGFAGTMDALGQATGHAMQQTLKKGSTWIAGSFGAALGFAMGFSVPSWGVLAAAPAIGLAIVGSAALGTLAYVTMNKLLPESEKPILPAETKAATS